VHRFRCLLSLQRMHLVPIYSLAYSSFIYGEDKEVGDPSKAAYAPKADVIIMRVCGQYVHVSTWFKVDFALNWGSKDHFCDHVVPGTAQHCTFILHIYGAVHSCLLMGYEDCPVAS